jgi:hypothetical protein
MVRFLLPVVVSLLGVAAGCLPQQVRENSADKSGTALVPPNPFGKTAAAPQPTRAAFAPASSEVAMQVDNLGRNILAANKQTALKPLFVTIGSPQPEVFHRGTSELEITEGLVRRCQSEGQLAAVLCLELGKMVSEREALAGAQTRSPDRRPPIEVPIGNAGQFGSPDPTRQVELAKFEQERRRAPERLPPPDPNALARIYLKNAGYAETELDGVAALLRAADASGGIEKQFKGQLPAQSWTR